MPQNTQSDPIQEFIALPRDQQLSTLQSLPADKQDKLLARVKEYRQKSKTPSFPTGEIRPLTQRERFLNPELYPVGVKGESVGENLKNLAQRGGVGIFQLADAATHPRQTVAGMIASVLPEPAVKAANQLVDLENKIPGMHYLTTKLPEGTENPLQSAYQAAITSRGPMELAGKAAPLAGQALAGEAFGTMVGPVTSDLMNTAAKARRGVGEVPLNTAKIMTGTGTRGTGKLVRETEAANKAIEGKNATEIEKTRRANDEAKNARKENIKSKAEEMQGKELTQAKKEKIAHDAEVEKVREHNARVKEKHAAVAKRIQEENAAQESVLNLRRQGESNLQKETDAYRAQEESEDTKAKSSENQAWAAWRGKIKDATLDGTEIAAPLNKLRLTSPEVDRTLNQLEPRGDEVPQESRYAQLRNQTAQSNFGGSYDSLSPTKQDAVDTMMTRAGESPDPIDFDVKEGQPIQVDRVQRAYSILQRYIRSGRFEGPLLGEMKQVAKVLRRAVTNASDELGALGDLNNARAETVRYQEAFGRERPEPRTVRGEREKSANPEEVKRLQEEERLEAASKYSPSLAEAQRRVKAAREALKKLPAEDQLRKATKQVPPPPTVGDFREGYRLHEDPTPPRPKLTSGSAEERTAQQIPEKPPQEPDITPKKTISPEDITERKRSDLQTAADRAASIGQRSLDWRTISVGGSLVGILAEMKGILPAAFALGGAVTAPLVMEALARFVERPDVVEKLTRITASDIEKVPPELRSQALQDMKPIVQQAQSQGIKVSPALAAFVGAAAVPQGPKTQNLQRMADEQRNGAQ